MQKREVNQKSPARKGLTTLWNLNFMAMPTALLWSVSLLVSLETSSFALRLMAIACCSVMSVSSSHLIRRKARPSVKFSLAETFQDSTCVGLLVITGLMYALTLENISRYSNSAQSVRFFFVGNFVTALILWFFVQVVIIPIRMNGESSQPGSATLHTSLAYVRGNRGALIVSFVPLLFGWVLFFFYFLLGLTFAQAVTYGTFDTDVWTKIGD